MGVYTKVLKVDIRDIKVKCKKLRKKGIISGTLKRSNGEIIPISLKGSSVDKHILNNGLNNEVLIIFNNEEINTKIDRLQRNLLIHNVINIDLLEKS